MKTIDRIKFNFKNICQYFMAYIKFSDTAMSHEKFFDILLIYFLRIYIIFYSMCDFLIKC